MRRVIFRADGNEEIGLGHVYRSLALAEMLKGDFKLIFIIKAPIKELRKIILQTCEECIELTPADSDKQHEIKKVAKFLEPDDIVVLDGYHFDGEYQKSVKACCHKVISIDDMHEGHFYSDFVLNHCGALDPDIYDREPYTELLLGEKYALLRPEFLNAARVRHQALKTNKKILFVNMGGSDFNNITQKIVEAVKEIDFFREINIVLGAANVYRKKITDLVYNDNKFNIYQNVSASEMCNIMKRSNLAIAPASSISFEICAVGLGFISGYYTKNQHDVVNWLNVSNCASIIGDLQTIRKRDIQKELAAYSTKESIRSMISNQQVIDGLSGERLNKVFGIL